MSEYKAIVKNTKANGRRPGGVAILCHKDWQMTEIRGLGEGPEDLAATVQDKRGNKTIIATTYVRPGKKVNESWIKRISEKAHREKRPLAISGDFNSPNETLGSNSTTSSGRILKETMEASNLNWVENKEPTYYS